MILKKHTSIGGKSIFIEQCETCKESVRSIILYLNNTNTERYYAMRKREVIFAKMFVKNIVDLKTTEIDRYIGHCFLFCCLIKETFSFFTTEKKGK